MDSNNPGTSNDDQMDVDTNNIQTEGSLTEFPQPSSNDDQMDVDTNNIQTEGTLTEFPQPSLALLPVKPPSSQDSLSYEADHFKDHPGYKELLKNVDICCYHLKEFASEREKIKLELTWYFLGNKLLTDNVDHIPRSPKSPNRLNRLMLDVVREHARVTILLSEMEKLRRKPFTVDIKQGMESWMESIRVVQLMLMMGCTYKDLPKLSEAISDMGKATRIARKLTYCAVVAAKHDSANPQNYK